MKRKFELFAAALILLALALPSGRALAQAASVTNENLNQMIAKAKTASDHAAAVPPAYRPTDAAHPESASSRTEPHSRTASTGGSGLSNLNWAVRIYGCTDRA